jgi:Ca2+-transporting ATPase
MEWERYTPEKLSKALAVDFVEGLSEGEVTRRQSLRGKNVLKQKGELHLVVKILKQFTNPLVFILLGAGLVTLILREYVDTVVIFVALFINVAVGTVQEERASRAFDRLRASQERFATVLRSGKRRVIPSSELVPGDVVEIVAGAYVPADVRILKSSNLSINEAALTGEWNPVTKHAEVLEKTVPITEQANMGWMGTLAVDGHGMGVVVATGNRTEVGIIAASLGGIDESLTPLQQNVRRLARLLVCLIAVALLAIFVLGYIRGESLGELLLIAIALAVATMPEGLPAAVTIVLALGMESILKRGGLVRNLLAAETLGATTVILTDKTGTLTEAKMRLASIFTLDSLQTKVEEKWTPDAREALIGAVLASDAFVEEIGSTDGEGRATVVVHGRPVERAIVLSAHDAGISRNELLKTSPQLDFVPFASKRGFGASLHGALRRKKRRLYLTGVPEELLTHAKYVYSAGRARVLKAGERKELERVQAEKSADGYRFIGVAYRDVSWEHIPFNLRSEEMRELAEDLVFLGFLAFEDPVRADVPAAIERVKSAGTSVIMLTGDNPETARKVACDVGISCDKEAVRIGSDIEELSDDDLFAELHQAKIFARMTPQQKLRIVMVLKSRGEIVAMTGDGINDAPALRSANIGIAVGGGTEVAKEAADLILIDNSFTIIVSAIEEGRKIIANLKKIIAYLLSTSFSEIFVIGSALAVGAPLPLLPGQILWANIIEEGVMSFPLAFERPGENLMKRSPRSRSVSHLLTRDLRSLIFTVSIVTGVFLVALYFWLLRTGLPIEEIRTIMFVALSLDAIFFVFSLKSFDTPLWRINVLNNPMLLVSLVISIALLLGAVSLPPLRFMLSLTTLSAFEMLLLLGVGLFNLLTIEVAKFVIFARQKRVDAVIQ